MKHSIKPGCYVLIFFLMLSQNIFSQGLKELFSNSETPVVYLGIDFSKARLLDVGNADDIRNRLYRSINELVINEPKKYDLSGAFHKGSISSDLQAVHTVNGKANINDILSTNQADFNRLKESDINNMVKALDLSGKQGIGMLFMMEAMRKIDKKGSAALWVTFVDMKTKKVLMTERIETKAAGGFGFRNYWASTIKALIDEIEKNKYKEWQLKFKS